MTQTDESALASPLKALTGSLADVLPSQLVPARLVHRGLQDGGPSDSVCAELHRRVRGVPGAGEPWEHPAIHALHNGE